MDRQIFEGQESFPKIFFFPTTRNVKPNLATKINELMDFPWVLSYLFLGFVIGCILSP